MTKGTVSNSRQKWALDVVKTLKPFIDREEQISRRVAIKAVNPKEEWQRRQLEKMRIQANKIIRRENCDVLIYTVWGMTLHHPSMKGELESFDNAIKVQMADFQYPDGLLKVQGIYSSPTVVNAIVSHIRHTIEPGYMWMIRPDMAKPDNTHFMFVETDTYVLIPVTKGVVATKGERYSNDDVYLATVNVLPAPIVAPPALPAEPDQAIKIEHVSQEEAYRREPKDGLAYSNNDGMFVCIEGKFRHMGDLSGSLGGPDPRAGEGRAMSEAELLAEHLGCKLNMVGVLENIKDLPKGGRIGDFCMYGNKLLAWNGKEWIFGTSPFNPVPKTAANLKVNHVSPAVAQPKLTWFERVKRAIGFK